MAASIWTETTGGIRKYIFVDTLLRHFYGLLYQFIVAG